MALRKCKNQDDVSHPFPQSSVLSSFTQLHGLMSALLSCHQCKAIKCFVHQNGNEIFFDKVDAVKQNMFFNAGEIIFREGEHFTGLYFIRKGKVKVFTKDFSSNEQIVRLSQKGEIIGCRGLGGKQIYPATASALTDAQLCFIKMDAMMELFHMNSSFAFTFAQFYARELKRAEANWRITYAEAKSTSGTIPNLKSGAG